MEPETRASANRGIFDLDFRTDAGHLILVATDRMGREVARSIVRDPAREQEVVMALRVALNANDPPLHLVE